MKGIRITVFGRVQGVGFRFYTKKKADELHVSGWVKNMPNGSVYIEVEGQDTDVNTFIDWCNMGTKWAHVEKVDRQDIPVQGFEGFVVK